MPLFSNSSGFSAKGKFNDYSTTIVNVSESRLDTDRVGLEKLLSESIPSATHDSSDRHPPPLCHPGTRDELIEQLVTWGYKADSVVEDVAWVKGPAGAGKSAVCQSSADSLGEHLGASFFFSRPNRRSDPKRFFTTIAYQLAVKYEPYGKLLDERIRKDPTILMKSLLVQFRELIAVPICQALRSGEVFLGRVIIIDGLDECEGAGYQGDILDIIARSAIDKTTPFRWIIASRLEPHIISKFDSPSIKCVTRHFEVTISRDLDPAIFRFLADKLAEVRQKHRLDESWPCEEDLHTLVELSSGMFAYAHVISLFIDDDDSTSPMEQLNLVLRLAKQANTESGSKHPLAKLDLFYTTLILERLPKEKCQAVRLILLADHLLGSTDSGVFTQAQRCANLLGHSEQTFRLLCRSFHAIMLVDPRETLQFYHASFMDFLVDPARSGQFCITSTDCVAKLLDHTKQALDDIQLDSYLMPRPHLAWGIPSQEHYEMQYHFLVVSFMMSLRLALLHGIPDEEKLAALNEWDFRKLTLRGGFQFRWVPCTSTDSYSWLRTTRGAKIVRPDIPTVGLSRFLNKIRKIMGTVVEKNVFILGHGKRSVYLKCDTKREVPLMTLRAWSSSDMEEFKKALYKESLAKASFT